MFFLLRMAFWLGVVLVLLPSVSPAHDQPATAVGASDAISAASATVQDLKGFCGREPDACTVGARIGTAIGYKAQAGAKMLYDFLTEALAPHETGSLGTTATKPVAGKITPQRASQNTLTSADLGPAWRGPPARKDATISRKPAA
jgi:hypothetical protein